MRRYVFVSHANPDKPKLRPLIEALLDAGIPLWIDRPEELGLGERHLNCGRILAGADWRAEISRGLENASCVLFLLSRGANAHERSDELIREFEHGKSRNILVVAQTEPIDRAELNPFFRLRQAIDISRPMAAPETTYARFDALIETLRKFLLADRAPLAGPIGSAAFTGGDPKREAFKGVYGAFHQQSVHPPRLLPYLTDRHEQQRRLAQVLQREIDIRRGKPVNFFVAGCETECVDSFVEQVRYVRLPAILESNGLHPDVLYRTLQWPSNEALAIRTESEIADQFREVEGQVLSALGLKITAEKASIARKLAASPGCCCFHIGINLFEWGPHQAALLRHWLAWWADLDLAKSKHPVVTLITIVYPSGLFSGFGRGRALNAVRRDIKRFAADARLNAVVQALPELKSVRFEDVDLWIREHAENVDREALRAHVRKQFSGFLSLGRRTLSMYKTAEVVKGALSNPEVRIATP